MIPYFAVGDSSTALRHLPGQRALITFAYVGSWVKEKHLPELESVTAGLMIDSGAFTIWRKGGDLPLAAYLEWLRTKAPRYEWAIGLDVIGNADASVANYETARAAEPRIVPVWHEGDPVEHLDHYARTAQLVGLGRTDGRRSEQKTLEFYDAAFNAQPDAKFHALGNANPVQLEPYPFWSFDSTGWQRDSVYSNAAKWPMNRCSKDTRIRAYIEATCSIEHRPSKQPTLMSWAAKNRREPQMEAS